MTRDSGAAGPSGDSGDASRTESVCELCGAALTAGRECSYCTHRYCAEHRLPENHDCSGVKGLDAVGKRFDSGFDSAAASRGDGTPDGGDGDHWGPTGD